MPSSTDQEGRPEVPPDIMEPRLGVVEEFRQRRPHRVSRHGETGRRPHAVAR